MTDLKPRLASFLTEIWTLGRLERIPLYLGDSYQIRHDPGDPWDGQTLTQQGFRDRVAKSRAAAPESPRYPRAFRGNSWPR